MMVVIYNCDETALFFKLLPDKSLAEKKDHHKSEGFKQLKNRLTLMFCVNKTGGHKLRPLCIGKFAKPRCFHHVNLSNLPLQYDYSKNAWMTQLVFSRWFKETFVPEVCRHMRAKGLPKKALLLMDQCPAHPQQRH